MNRSERLSDFESTECIERVLMVVAAKVRQW